MKVVPIKFSEEMYADLKALSLAEGLPMSVIVRNYLHQPLKKLAQKKRQTPSPDIARIRALAGSIPLSADVQHMDLDTLIEHSKKIYFSKK